MLPKFKNLGIRKNNSPYFRRLTKKRRMKRIKYLLLALIVSGFVFAQNENWFYATIDRPNAEMLMAAHPDKVQLIHSHNGISAVYLESEAALSLKKYQRILNKDGLVHLKTDSEFLYGYTHGILQLSGTKS